MTYLAEHAIAGPLRMPPVRHHHVPRAAKPPRCRDKRWPAVVSALTKLRTANRRGVRIVDADCDGGTLLLCAVRMARVLGFTAIEARGIGDTTALVDRACSAAAKLHDPAIGITFETADLVDALSAEADFPADILLWHGGKDGRFAATAVARAGHVLIADPDQTGGAEA